MFLRKRMMEDFAQESESLLFLTTVQVSVRKTNHATYIT